MELLDAVVAVMLTVGILGSSYVAVVNFLELAAEKREAKLPEREWEIT